MKKLKMGMIGGGKGSFIGNVHHMAAVLDNKIELVCGAFSSNPQTSFESGKDYYLPDNRVYGSWEEMIEKESELNNDDKMDFVAIVTPNNVHYEPAKKALQHGFHVICDKPLTMTQSEALDLEGIVKESGLIFAVTHAYTGYPIVKEAKHIIQSGKLGTIRKVFAEYHQGWLASPEEKTGNKQAGWRTDPKKAGASCTMGDVGVHAFNLLDYITGLKLTEICADISSLVEGRLLDDDGSVLLRYKNGAKGVLTASQVCAGEENNIIIKIYGEKGGIEWRQMEPNTLLLKWLNKPTEIIRTGIGMESASANLHFRVPPGHPEGYIEAFANTYRNFAMAVSAYKNNTVKESEYDFPDVIDGVNGMKFIEKVLESSKSKEKWLKY